MKITENQLAQIIRKNTLPGQVRSNIDFDAAANQINELMKPKWKDFDEWLTDFDSDGKSKIISWADLWKEARK